MSPWSCEVVSKIQRIPFSAGQKEIPKLYHSPWVSVGVPGGRPTGKQLISALCNIELAPLATVEVLNGIFDTGEDLTLVNHLILATTLRNYKCKLKSKWYMIWKRL